MLSECATIDIAKNEVDSEEGQDVGQEPAESPIGRFEVELLGPGRGYRARHTATRFSARCDAVAHFNGELLLASLCGPETSLKSIIAGLRSSGKDQQRLRFSVSIPGLRHERLEKSEGGYRVSRTKLGYGLWHTLILAKRSGFLPVMSEETVWAALSGDKYTTPLCADWAAWLYKELLKNKLLKPLQQAGICNSGLLLCSDEQLDNLVARGVKSGALAIGGQTAKTCDLGRIGEAVEDLDSYMMQYGQLLGKQAERALSPLHLPGEHALPECNLLREPFDAQAHAIQACVKTMKKQAAVLMVMECGTGKTIMSIGAVHQRAAGKPYRALVMCPPQLVAKWQRELKETVSECEVYAITNWKQLLHLDKHSKPAVPEWFVMSRETAKLGSKWRAAFVQRSVVRRGLAELPDGPFLRCPDCGQRLVDGMKCYVPKSDLEASKSYCTWVVDADNKLGAGCGAALWTMIPDLWRYEPAKYIHKRLPGFFRYLVLDEVHELKGGGDVAQANAAGSLAAAVQRTLALTGTLVGGYANHLRPILFRLAPRSLVNEGLGWKDETAFNERYGRIETTIREKSGGGKSDDNKQSRGSSKSVSKSVKPGVMPALFGRHLLDKSVFLSLEDVAANLPPQPLDEPIPVKMDAQLAGAYAIVEEKLREAIRLMLVKGDRRLLGAMLQTLLQYPDLPYDWEAVGYWERSAFVTVVIPPNLPVMQREKELAALGWILNEKAAGRKVWVYVQYVGKHDVQSRLVEFLRAAALKVGVLKSSVKPSEREQWINDNGAKYDVMVSNCELVKTGLDFFDKEQSYNYPSILFYETGYNTFSLRQASRRAWRIGQRWDCKVAYLYYTGTMQERAIALIGKKLKASLALEGQFSTEGLAALGGEDGNLALALAQSLVNRMDEGDARRAWGKIGEPRTPVAAMLAPVESPVVLAEPEPASVIAYKTPFGQGLFWDIPATDRTAKKKRR